MDDKYQNKYRIASTRLQNWDYGRNGSYFITICTKNREYFFGDIVVVETPESGVSTTQKMVLSDIGKIAEKYWFEIPQHFPFVKLGSFIVMPNHIHGIIIIDKPDEKNHNDAKTYPIVNENVVETPKLGVSTTTTATNNKKWKPGTLGTIINQYKRICTIQARKTNPVFAWQSRFYDHIIRNRKSYRRISQYIKNNPIKWEGDKFNA